MSEDMQQIFADADCLHPADAVEREISRMAAEINAAFGQLNPLVYCVMKGGLIFAGKILPLLNFPMQLGYIHATRYRDATTGKELDWKVPPSEDMTDRHVVLLDDILDEGATLKVIVEYCKAEGAARVYSAVLVDKKHDRKCDPNMQCDFVGLQVVDRYLFGYGMDYKGYWRNAPGIYAVKGL